MTPFVGAIFQHLLLLLYLFVSVNCDIDVEQADCQWNEFVVECGGCEATCESPEVSRHCGDTCKPRRCECVRAKGYVRAKDGACVHLADCVHYDVQYVIPGIDPKVPKNTILGRLLDDLRKEIVEEAVTGKKKNHKQMLYDEDSRRSALLGETPERSNNVVEDSEPSQLTTPALSQKDTTDSEKRRLNMPPPFDSTNTTTGNRQNRFEDTSRKQNQDERLLKSSIANSATNFEVEIEPRKAFKFVVDLEPNEIVKTGVDLEPKNRSKFEAVIESRRKSIYEKPISRVQFFDDPKSEFEIRCLPHCCEPPCGSCAPPCGLNCPAPCGN